MPIQLSRQLTKLLPTNPQIAPVTPQNQAPKTIIGKESTPVIRLMREISLKASKPDKVPVCAPFTPPSNNSRQPIRSKPSS